MTRPELDTLIQRGKDGTLSAAQQALLAREMEIYRDMALRLERAVHDLVKSIEDEIDR